MLQIYEDFGLIWNNLEHRPRLERNNVTLLGKRSYHLFRREVLDDVSK